MPTNICLPTRSQTIHAQTRKENNIAMLDFGLQEIHGGEDAKVEYASFSSRFA